MGTEQNLIHWIDLAKAVSKKAYCPYSKFQVGAVVITESGIVKLLPEAFGPKNLKP